MLFRSSPYAFASLLAAFVLTAGACTKHAPAETQTAGVSASSFPAVTIKYADPGNAGLYAYAKKHGSFIEPLAKVNAKIEWVPALGAFSANFEAMNTGAINASGAAISPIIGALAHNLRFKIFAVADRIDNRQDGIIVPAASAIRSVKELVGKRVAVNAAAHGDYLLLRALELAGVPADSVERVPIQPPDAAAAFATGKIDAWATFGVFFNTAVRRGAHVVVYEEDLKSDDIGVNSANAETLERNPAAFRVFVSVLQDLVRKAHANPEAFQNVFTDKGPTAVQGEDLRLAIEETRKLAVPRIPTDADRQRVAAVAALFLKNGSIDRDVAVNSVVFDLDAAVHAQTASAPEAKAQLALAQQVAP